MRDFTKFAREDQALRDRVRDAALERQAMLTDFTKGDAETFKCSDCDKHFDTERGLKVHRYRTHGEN